MDPQAVIAALHWYLEHLHYILFGAALFDVVCWLGIFLVYKRVRRGRSFDRPDNI